MRRLYIAAAGSLLALALLFGCLPAHALGQQRLVLFDAPPAGAVTVAQPGHAAPLYVDPADHAGVLRAARDLQGDIERVTGVAPALRDGTPGQAPGSADAIIIGTVGHSPLIDRLVAAGMLDVSAIRGKWEGWQVQTLVRPLPGVDRALVIAGSDKRGTIYGIYEMSEQIGVSPWHWWADVPAARHARLYAHAPAAVHDAPVVRYRGIFLNDEQPALTGWVQQNYGGYNHRFYEKVFELLLRLRANYLWPAMWNAAFYADDPLNGKLADDYGIVMGTSHHEPMMRAQKEWTRRNRDRQEPWDYQRNGPALQDFWRGGVRNARAYEKVITIGMRGDGDEPMSEAANVALLERIVADQRGIIGSEMQRDPATVPQTWALYKEVQDYYEKGMRVPDDVTLLWCDDNWGNIRRLPTPDERRRAGGAGVYYHFDYVGGPRSYKWLNVTPLPKIWEQMHLAWRHDATRLWIVNVGDLKPMEVPTEFFLAYAWNPAAWPAQRLPEYLKLWATREFGAQHADDIAGIVAGYTRYNGRRKPEQLAPDTYHLVNYDEAERVVEEFRSLAARAQRIAALIPAERRDAYFQLVQYPAQASAIVNELYATAGRNRLYATQGRTSANDLAAHARSLFAQDAELTRRYHQDTSGGKWNHMMSQTHLGYTYWNQPPRNVMPAVSEVQAPPAPDMGVAVQGSAQAWPGPGGDTLSLPAIDEYGGAPVFLEVFNRGQQPFDYRIAASAPWIIIDHAGGQVVRDRRVHVGVRWADVPAGVDHAVLTVTGPGGARVDIRAPLRRLIAGAAPGDFIETAGVVAIEAAHYASAVAPPGRDWLTIPGHGRTDAGVTALPVTAALGTAPETGADAAADAAGDTAADAAADAARAAQRMRLDYPVYLREAGDVVVHATLAPTQKFQPGPGLRYGVSFDDEPPQLVNLHADGSEAAWEKTVSDGATVLASRHRIAAAGRHTLTFWAVDPGVVLQKLVVDTGGLRESYLGPPESPRARR
ncbi:MAG: glycosyl hydrolase 115 family protein [Duganella sp.]